MATRLETYAQPPGPKSAAQSHGDVKLDESIIIAIAFNLILLAISWLAATKSGIIISSLVWILIGFALFKSYSDVLLLGITYMIAFAQIFIPMNPRANRSQ